MDIESLKLLSLVAEHGSFAAAARVLEVDPSSVSRAISHVEDDLGVRLFQRTTRKLSPTEAGARYIRQITPLLEELDHARDEITEVSREPAGVLKMTTSVSFGHICVVPHLKEFKEKYPSIGLELLTTDSNVNLVAENIDLAVRLTPAPVGDLISTKLMQTHYAVCASPDYLASHPKIVKPEDLLQHGCLCFPMREYRDKWCFKSASGSLTEVEISGNVVISNALSLRLAALNGLGPALLPTWLVEQDLKTGKLNNVFPDFEATASSFDTCAWALYPSRSYLPKKVRVMIDFLKGKYQMF